jgi:hypothetical protein
MIATYTFLTFEEWKERNLDLVGKDDEDCPCCKGIGFHARKRGKNRICRKCNCTGRMLPQQKYKYYLKQLKLDKVRLEKWTGKPLAVPSI